MKSRSLTPMQNELIDAMLTLKGRKELVSFLQDLLTESELKELSCRWKAARMLDSEEPYSEIITVTGLSSTTVARVSKWMKAGAGGYRLALNRLRRLKKS